MSDNKKIQCAVLVTSDRCSRGEAEDKSGPVLKELIEASLPNSEVFAVKVVPDDVVQIQAALIEFCENAKLIITSGGTGFAPRDVTPEATKRVIEKECSGLVVGMLAASLQITPMTMLSRPCAGIRGSTLIINMPGSPKAVKELFEAVKTVLPHGLRLIEGSDDPHPVKKA